MAKFSNLDKYCLWEMANTQIKVDDQDTQQALYEGEYRGQAQRYHISLGDLIVTLFSKIDELYTYGDMFVSDKSLFEYLQKQFYAYFFTANTGNEDLVRNVLEEIINAWRLKGTIAFFHWIIWKIFGWQVLYVKSLHSTVLKWSLPGRTLYAPGAAIEDIEVLYDPAEMAEDLIVIVVDVFSDTAYTEKKATLESLVHKWGHGVSFEYNNIP